jgi:hypothetical protein
MEGLCIGMHAKDLLAKDMPVASDSSRAYDAKRPELRALQ